MATKYSARTPMITGIIALFILVAGFGGWAVMTRLAGAVIAEGRVEVDQNRQVVNHPDGGIVSRILIEEGQSVDAGDILIEFDDAERRSLLLAVEGQYFNFLAQHARLTAERDEQDAPVFRDELTKLAQDNPEAKNAIEGQERLFATRAHSLATQIDQLNKRKTQIERQIEGLEVRIESQDTQLSLIQEELAKQKTLLEKQLTQSSQVLALSREEASMQGSIDELKTSVASAKLQVTETTLQILALETDRREQAIADLRQLEPSLLEVREQRERLRRELERQKLRAPVSGVVHGLEVFVERSVLQPGAPLLYLVRRDRPLVISVQIDPLHIDLVHLDQEVHLQFPAFDAKTTPDIMGRVARVSPESFSDDRTGASYFTAEIHLDADQLALLPDGAELLPGMPVSAYLRTQDQSPLSYLIQPLADYFRKALRES